MDSRDSDFGNVLLNAAILMKKYVSVLLEAGDQTEPTSAESQEKMIRKALEAGRKITPMSALIEYNCMRLGARIHRLKSHGLNITSTLIELSNGKRVAQYSIKQ